LLMVRRRRFQQSRHSLRWKYRVSVEQNNVTADAESRTAYLEMAGAIDGILERSPRCHERGGGDDSLFASLGNRAVDPRGHSEVVSIDDEPAHRFSVASKKKGAIHGPLQIVKR
jgi:hypothetical protein